MGRYLVTGGAGFIGSHIATALAERGDTVRVLDDLSGGLRENLSHLDLGPEGSGAQVELIVGSITDPAFGRRACRGAEGIFHEAAQVSVPQSVEEPEKSYEINVTGQKWQWFFTYPNGHVATELHVPVDKPVKLTMTSEDVIHDFFW